jgi:hypothetical protein
MGKRSDILSNDIEDPKLILGFPALPSLVVMTNTPLAARDPHKAAAEAPLSI